MKIVVPAKAGTTLAMVETDVQAEARVR